MDKIKIARAAIIEDLHRRGKAGDPSVRPTKPEDAHRWYGMQSHYYCGGGTMSCPVCKTGTLRYSRASYNGHIHAACSTATCVRWME